MNTNLASVPLILRTLTDESKREHRRWEVFVY